MPMNLHVVIVPTNCERETTGDFRYLRSSNWAAEGAARKHGLLLLIEANGTKLLPVADQLILHNDFVNGKLSLQNRLA